MNQSMSPKLANPATIDPFTQHGSSSHGILNAILATALFRCWHLIIFFSAWAATVCLISDNVYNLAIQPTLLTVFGTVLGFVISYRTSSSYERYNEGRRYWSSIVYGSRALARTIWFHVPFVDVPAEKYEEMRAQTLLERKSAINLIEAYAVAVKHYLRGEETIYYQDLYHLVKFLPVYILPAGRPSLSNESPAIDLNDETLDQRARSAGEDVPMPTLTNRKASVTLPPLVKTTSATPPQTLFGRPSNIDVEKAANAPLNSAMLSPPLAASASAYGLRRSSTNTVLLPASNPPKYALFDVFPFSMFVNLLVKKGKDVKGKKSARLRARAGNINHNIPLEITFYISSYISELQRRKILDVPTLTTLINNLHLLIDSLTGLERILTTPIPWSYSIHLRLITGIFVFLLPFQTWTSLKWLTIPATAIATLIFFGFLVAGEEIENPFGYDKNDLNLDHFTHNIIRVELAALTSRPPPTLTDWALNPGNVNAFPKEAGVTPQEWMERGEAAMREALARMEIK